MGDQAPLFDDAFRDRLRQLFEWRRDYGGSGRSCFLPDNWSG